MKTHKMNHEEYVVVQFYPCLKLYFLLFLGMVMYDNEFEAKEMKFKSGIELNPNIDTTSRVVIAKESRASSFAILSKLGQI